MAHEGLQLKSVLNPARLLLLSALLGVASAHPFLNAAAYQSLGNRFNVTLTNYGGPYDGVSAEDARSGAGRMFGVLNGGCGYYKVPKDDFPWLSAVAFDPECPGIQGLPSFACGSCWRFTCVKGSPGCTSTRSIVATVTDICPGCSRKFGSQCHADLHFSAFEMISPVGPGGGGLANVMVERVACEVPGHTVTLRVMDNSGPYTWMRVVVWRANGHGIIKRLRMLCENDGKHTLVPHDVDFENKWGATWELNKQPWGHMCRFEMTDDAGQTLKSALIDMSQHRGHGIDRDIELGMQFGGPTPPAVPPAPPAVTTPALGGGQNTGSNCSDDPPKNAQGYADYTCKQQVSWGKCSESFMQGHCNRSCGRC